jgi:flagellar basal-body rod protein FlgF
MQLTGHLTYQGDGMGISTKAMMTQMTVLKSHTDNIANFGVPGYQRKEAVITSFAEHLGPNAVDQVTSDEIGRLRRSGNPMDFAINNKGYFQRLMPSGEVELTRDGRFRLDKDGYLLSVDDKHILSTAGMPIRFSTLPKDMERQVKVASDGTITVYDDKQGKMLPQGQIAVVSKDGGVASEVDVKQGYVEDSNVFLQREYVAIMPLRRQFEANRQLFIMQSDSLSRMIQELGRAQ